MQKRGLGTGCLAARIFEKRRRSSTGRMQKLCFPQYSAVDIGPPIPEGFRRES